MHLKIGTYVLGAGRAGKAERTPISPERPSRRVRQGRWSIFAARKRFAGAQIKFCLSPYFPSVSRCQLVRRLPCQPYHATKSASQKKAALMYRRPARISVRKHIRSRNHETWSRQGHRQPLISPAHLPCHRKSLMSNVN